MGLFFSRRSGKRSSVARRPAGRPAVAAAARVTAELLEDRRLFSTAFGLLGTGGSVLVKFDTATPGTIQSAAVVSGLQPTEKLLGIDFRPANGQLYAVGSSGRVYRLDQTTGAVLSSVVLTADPTSTFAGLNGTNFGVDFNPVPDRLRVVSNNGQNLRINVDTGATISDAALNSTAGSPNIRAAAYTNPFAGAASTTLYTIDGFTGSLYIQNPPNAGTEVLVGSLGVTTTGNPNFDIAQSGTAYAAILGNFGTQNNLYTINLGTGAATLVGAIGNAGEQFSGLAVRPDNLPPTANPDFYSVDEDNTLVVNAPGPLGNDTDPEGTQLNLNNVTMPANGTLVGFSPTTGAFTYKPNANFNGTDTFTYRAFDGQNLSAPTTVTITVNPQPESSVTVADVQQNEGDSGTTNFVFTITRTGDLTEAASVGYATADGPYNNATRDVDYVAADAVATFAPGQATATVTVAVIGETAAEMDETFTLNLFDPTNTIVTTPSAVGTISNDDQDPTVSVDDAAVTEGNSGTKNLTFNVTLTAPSNLPITVKYATTNGTATAGSDYTATSGTLTFFPSQTSQTVSVPVKGDTTVEANETFRLVLSEADNALQGDFSGTGTILNDDTAPPPPPKASIRVNNESDFEGTSGLKPVTFTVSLDAASTKTVTVKYATANGTASSASDYNAASGTLTFAPGETSKLVTVFVKGDKTKEADETFFVNLSGAVNATIATGQGRGLIRNDD